MVAELRARAGRTLRRVVLPETGDSRTLDAVRGMVSGRVVSPVLVLDPDRPETHGPVRELAESLDLRVVEPGPDGALATAMDLTNRAQRFAGKVVTGSPGTVVYTTNVELSPARRR